MASSAFNIDKINKYYSLIAPKFEIDGLEEWIEMISICLSEELEVPVERVSVFFNTYREFGVPLSALTVSSTAIRLAALEKDIKDGANIVFSGLPLNTSYQSPVPTKVYKGLARVVQAVTVPHRNAVDAMLMLVTGYLAGFVIKSRIYERTVIEALKKNKYLDNTKEYDDYPENLSEITGTFNEVSIKNVLVANKIRASFERLSRDKPVKHNKYIRYNRQTRKKCLLPSHEGPCYTCKVPSLHCSSSTYLSDKDRLTVEKLLVFSVNFERAQNDPRLCTVQHGTGRGDVRSS